MRYLKHKSGLRNKKVDWEVGIILIFLVACDLGLGFLRLEIKKSEHMGKKQNHYVGKLTTLAGKLVGPAVKVALKC